MLKTCFICLFFIFFNTAFGQVSTNVYFLKINGKTTSQTQIIDSMGYEKKHQNLKSVTNEAALFLKNIQKKGYFETEIIENKKENDSTFFYLINLGNRTNEIHIYIDKTQKENLTAIYKIENDSLKIPIQDCEDFLNSTIKNIENKGFSMAKVALKNIQKKKNYAVAELKIDLNKKRQLNDIVINGYDKFPVGFKKNLVRLYKKQVFNQQNLELLYKDINQYRFVKQTKYPEILFTKDSTKVFVYLDKTKANSFDGFVGFSNNDTGKLIFTGNINLALNNLLNTGEKTELFWKSDGKNQKTFNLNVELPYVFNSPFALKTQLNIFKQDSTFQNTKTAIDLGYYISTNSKVFLGFQSTESSDIRNQNSTSLNDYKNNFITTNYDFVDFKPNDFLFPEKTNVNFKVGTGKRTDNFDINQQYFANLFLKHNFYLNEKNSISLKSQNMILQSSKYLTNELFRFGGINSIRGFAENNLQGNLFTSLLSEYRYELSPSLYIHSIIDYGYYQDKTTNNSGKLLGLGFGFGILTKNGLLNLVFSNGSTNNQIVKLSNSIIQISLKTVF